MLKGFLKATLGFLGIVLGCFLYICMFGAGIVLLRNSPLVLVFALLFLAVSFGVCFAGVYQSKTSEEEEV